MVEHSLVYQIARAVLAHFRVFPPLTTVAAQDKCACMLSAAPCCCKICLCEDVVKQHSVQGLSVSRACVSQCLDETCAACQWHSCCMHASTCSACSEQWTTAASADMLTRGVEDDEEKKKVWHTILQCLLAWDDLLTKIKG